MMGKLGPNAIKIKTRALINKGAFLIDYSFCAGIRHRATGNAVNSEFMSSFRNKMSQFLLMLVLTINFKEVT
jgi:hypothetical protein